PGTTRDLVTERVSFEGIPVELIDTAGLRDSPEGLLDEAESIGIGKSREAMAEADLILLVLDATAPLHAEDAAALAAHPGRPLLVALNKQDLAPSASLPGYPHIRTSALTGEGVPELRAAVLDAIAAPGRSADA